MVKILAVIPARSGSKGVPNKNIRKLKGHSLLDWSISACRKSKFINDIFVSTDSYEYQKISIMLGAFAPFLRPKELAADTSTDYEMVIHLLDWLSKYKSMPDLLVHIRPTTPLRDPEIIDKAINNFMKSENKTALRSVHIMSESSFKTFKISESGNLMPIFSEKPELDIANNPRQMFPDTYVANGYVDVLSPDFILKSGSIHGNRVMPFKTPCSVEVDCENDFLYLNYLVEKDPNILKKLFS